MRTENGAIIRFTKWCPKMFKRQLNYAPLHDEDVVTMSLPARFVWAYLPCLADREGRLDDKPLSIKLNIMVNDDVDMDKILDELAERRHIIRYSIDNKKYIEIRNFARYQRIHPNEAVSRIPNQQGKINGIPVGKPTSNGQMSLHGEPKVPQGEANDRSFPPLNTYTYTDTLTDTDTDKGVNQDDEILEIPFNNKSFDVLFGGWPPQEDPKFNEKKKDAELAFYSNINESNINQFVQAWDKRINLYKTDTSKNRRFALGTFRTFCEGRWTNVDQLEKFSKQTKPKEGFITEVFAEPKE